MTLFGSLAATGKGHLTDTAIEEALSTAGKVSIDWQPKIFLPAHPNAMKIAVEGDDGEKRDEWTFYSVGGGAIKCDRLEINDSPDIYPLNTMTELLEWCNANGRAYWDALPPSIPPHQNF